MTTCTTGEASTTPHSVSPSSTVDSLHACQADSNLRRLIFAAFSMAGKPARALKAYEKAHSWKELFTLASTQKIEPDAMSDLIEKIAG